MNRITMTALALAMLSGAGAANALPGREVASVDRGSVSTAKLPVTLPTASQSVASGAEPMSVVDRGADVVLPKQLPKGNPGGPRPTSGF